MLRGARQNNPGAGEHGASAACLASSALAAPAPEGFSVVDSANSWNAFSTVAKPTPQNLGSTPGPTSRARLSNLSRQLVPKCWRRYRGKRACRETSWCPDFAANSPMQLINTRQKGVSPRKPSFRAPNMRLRLGHSSIKDIGLISRSELAHLAGDWEWEFYGRS